jgi:hypothetical protein
MRTPNQRMIFLSERYYCCICGAAPGVPCDTDNHEPHKERIETAEHFKDKTPQEQLLLYRAHARAIG